MKRIVICADGTWNLRDQKDKKTGKRRPTNVTKVARAITPRTVAGVDQVVFYHDGVGTGGLADKLTGGAFGAGIENNIRNLYRSIVYNYVPGDELYFFGFSRGAFTVRTLVGFLNLIGLVEKDDDYFVPDLYECYEKGWKPGSPQWLVAHRKITNIRPCPPIRFVGVWDTVGALGAPGFIGKVASLSNQNKYDYHDVALHDTVENAYQALAIDERRTPFKPDLWVRPDNWRGTLEQGWFPGVHSNVGGGYTPDGLANNALHWIVDKAKTLGLEVDDVYLAPFQAHFDAFLHNSMSLKYRVFGAYDRPIGDGKNDGQFIHPATIGRWTKVQPPYRPVMLKKYFERTGTTP